MRCDAKTKVQEAARSEEAPAYGPCSLTDGPETLAR
jgi:hypothetical protein